MLFVYMKSDMFNYSNAVVGGVVCVGNFFIREFDPNILVVP
jgi:hypothetical protein